MQILESATHIVLLRMDNLSTKVNEKRLITKIPSIPRFYRYKEHPGRNELALEEETDKSSYGAL